MPSVFNGHVVRTSRFIRSLTCQIIGERQLRLCCIIGNHSSINNKDTVLSVFISCNVPIIMCCLCSQVVMFLS